MVEPAERASKTSDKEKRPVAALDQTLALLRSKDDTSRFVGLTLLKSLFDNERDLRDDDATVRRCWDAIPSRFLDRLLRAEPKEKRSAEEARHMVDLAVAVIHTFAVLTASKTQDQNRKLVSNTAGLVSALEKSLSETTTVLILQTLLTFASGEHGAASILAMGDLSPLLEIAPQHSLSLDVSKHALLRSALKHDPGLDFQEKLDGIILGLLSSFKKGEAAPFLEFVADVVSRVPPETISPKPPWLRPVSNMIRRSILSRPSFGARRASTVLSSALLQTYPTTFPQLLFRQSPGSNADNDKPFPYLFLNLVLIDVRSSFPSIMETLGSADYQGTSQRLSAGFDIVSAFIGYLVQSLEEEGEDADDDPLAQGLLLPPDLLLKLRRDISETVSLTIEFLRDRWDGSQVTSTAGPAKEAEPSKALPASTSSSSIVPMPEDPLTLAAIRALALWIREDDSPSLRKEAASIMDVLLGLYSQSIPVGSAASMDQSSAVQDFTTPVLLGLEPILTTKAGQDAFADHEGFPLLWNDLSTRLSDAISRPRVGSPINDPLILHLLRSSLPEAASLTPVQASSLPSIVSASCALTSSHDQKQPTEIVQDLYRLVADMLQCSPTSTRRQYQSQIRELRSATRVREQELNDPENDEQEEWQELVKDFERL